MPELFPVSIGGFVAHGFALPEKLPWGGSQRLGVHQLPAGVRIVDAMGSDDIDITWRGMFLSGDSSDPVETARTIDAARKRGSPVILAWDAFRYSVIIEQFKPEYEYVSRIPFEIVCKVVADLTAPVATTSGNNIAPLMIADMANSLNSAMALNMQVPSQTASAFSTTTGAQSPGPTAITWSGNQDFSNGP